MAVKSKKQQMDEIEHTLNVEYLKSDFTLENIEISLYYFTKQEAQDATVKLMIAAMNLNAMRLNSLKRKIYKQLNNENAVLHGELNESKYEYKDITDFVSLMEQKNEFIPGSVIDEKIHLEKQISEIENDVLKSNDIIQIFDLTTKGTACFGDKFLTKEIKALTNIPADRIRNACKELKSLVKDDTFNEEREELKTFC